MSDTTATKKSTWSRKLSAIGACSEAVEWAKDQPDFQTAWNTCERAEWMLWLAGRLAYNREGWPTRKQVVFASRQCARTALKFVPKKEKRVLACIETAEAWTRGEATIEQVREARQAAAYAAAADAAAYAAAYAAAARTKALKEMAEIVRQHLTPGEL